MRVRVRVRARVRVRVRVRIRARVRVRVRVRVRPKLASSTQPTYISMYLPVSPYISPWHLLDAADPDPDPNPDPNPEPTPNPDQARLLEAADLRCDAREAGERAPGLG